ncbi:MAG: hypothetical protein E7557_02895 [Ruminococcaceae bacterium]|nr:hypothetical protein [Oscillospiraceae bacterium]
MGVLKRIISVCLTLALVVSFVGVSAVTASALSENARYYESIPETAYATVGEVFKIYYNNVLSLPGLKVVFNIPQDLKKSYFDDRIEITAEFPGDFSIPWRVYDSEYVLVDSGEMLFVAREINLKNATGLLLGDSTVNAGTVTQTMLDIYEQNGKTLTLLGTRGTAPNLHEGRGGWTASMYCNIEEQGLYQNPFYNDGFDFSYYMNSQGYSKLDFVIIQLGINDIKKMTLENYSSRGVLSNFEKIISSIREYNSKVPIIIGVTIPPSEKVSDFNENYVFSSEFEYRNNIIHFASDLIKYFDGFSNLYFSAINCVIDTGNELSDLVHPTSVGYRNIAKQYISTLNCLFNPKIEVKAPAISSVSNSNGSIVLKWTATYGAKGYYILRDNKVLGVVDALSYRDVSIESGGKYTYKIKAVCEDGNAYISKAKTAYYLGTPVLKSATNVQAGVSVKWGAVATAKEYNVYRKTANGSWSKLGKTTGTSYTDKTAKSGTKYFYTVIATSSVAKSSYDNYGVSSYFIATPKLSSVTNKNNSTVVKWTAVKGAKGYNVYRKTSKNGSWTKVAKTTGTSYTDKSVKSGSNYFYTVKAYNGSTFSSYNTSGIATKYLSVPKITKVTSKTTGVSVSYNSVSGAKGYNIYRKTGKGSWVKIATVNGNSKTTYLDKTAKKNTTYTYTVRAVNGKYISYYNTKGVSVKDKY